MALLHRPHLDRTIGLLGLWMLGGCPTKATTAEPAPNTAEPTAPTDEAAPTSAPRCEALPTWRYEKIPLPPEFAPTLPEGVEVLWFAPGMFEPAADDYFTYAFSLDMTEPLSTPAALETLLVDYYRGLMSAVAAGRDAKPARDAVVELGGDGQTATIELSDEFTDGGVITLHLRVSRPEGPKGGCLRVLASARPTDANWAALETAHSCLCDQAP